MIFKTEPGKKARNDKKIRSKCPHCGHEETLLLQDLAKWIRAKAKIERRCYPHGKGEMLLREFLVKCTVLDLSGNPIYTIEECCMLFDLESREGNWTNLKDINLD